MIYVFLADGFEEVEALAPVDIMRRAGLSVQTVGIGGRTVTGAHGITVTADVTEETLTPDDIEAVVLPGGMPGTKNLEASGTVATVLEKAVQEGVLIAAICAAPSVLGHRGILRGKRATCYPGFESALEGAVLTDGGVVRDGNVLTACGAGVALEFGFQLVSALCSEEKADSLREAMRCP
ncbi:MAG: DJ-1/PfpI family protein [Ruminococcaceae bacterium]|nr:DJ-1/PfpI family protein [Oscillospiraceae bacterium]